MNKARQRIELPTGYIVLPERVKDTAKLSYPTDKLSPAMRRNIAAAIARGRAVTCSGRAFGYIGMISNMFLLPTVCHPRRHSSGQYKFPLYFLNPPDEGIRQEVTALIELHKLGRVTSTIKRSVRDIETQHDLEGHNVVATLTGTHMPDLANKLQALAIACTPKERLVVRQSLPARIDGGCEFVVDIGQKLVRIYDHD